MSHTPLLSPVCRTYTLYVSLALFEGRVRHATGVLARLGVNRLKTLTSKMHIALCPRSQQLQHQACMAPSSQFEDFNRIQMLICAGELCLILDINQNGRRFIGTKINPQILLSAMGNINVNLLFHITNILT